MAFSESTFIYPPESGGDVRMRIFTPGDELPMAGHPTIGSTFALAIEGVIARGRERFVFELGVGPTPVSLEWDDNGLSFAWMTQPLPAFGTVIEDRAAWRPRSGIASDLVDRLPIQSVSCGVPFLFVPMRTRAAVDAVAIDRKALGRCCQEAGLPELPVFFFTTEARGPKRSTAACWRLDLALQKILQPAARAVRSARTSCATESSTPTKHAQCSACRASR